MTPERWERLKPLFHAALEQPPGRRAAWLEQACPDEALRAEVLALLRSHDSAGDFLETPAAIDAGAAGEGRQLGPYLIRGELGRGGMGIVYLAEDVRLGRTVALKALPPVLADDETRRERLRREARAAAALTHPGIAVVYALEEFDGELFIASEHVKGQTLKSELAAGPLGWERALDTAIEIARALCAAHEAGIVHRDLKPENVLRAADGHVKILDFGIAQFADRTLTQLTMTGAVLGTPAYMAPEQLAGGEADFRVDLYALGVLLVEMTTGAHPFGTGAAPRLPEGIRAIAERCLARDPAERPSSTRELVSMMERIRAGLVAGAPADAPAGTFTPRWWWEFHQGLTALVYWLMAIPLWTARGVIGGAMGRMVFVTALAAIVVSANVRLHLWFTSRFYPGELPWVRLRTTRWVTAADSLFASVTAGAGLLVGDAQPALATLLLAVGIGAAVAFLVIEPVTERAAFRDSQTPR
jgi:hypothetical protein